MVDGDARQKGQAGRARKITRMRGNAQLGQESEADAARRVVEQAQLRYEAEVTETGGRVVVVARLQHVDGERYADRERLCDGSRCEEVEAHAAADDPANDVAVGVEDDERMPAVVDVGAELPSVFRVTDSGALGVDPVVVGDGGFEPLYVETSILRAGGGGDEKDRQRDEADVRRSCGEGAGAHEAELFVVSSFSERTSTGGGAGTRPNPRFPAPMARALPKSCPVLA
jgi:hypothetical protein